MKLTASVVAVLAALAFMGTAYATMPGQMAEFAGGPMGKIEFSGQIHADAGLNCNDCHTAIFEMKREAKITMDDHNAGNYCFSCHQEGGRAFAHTNCARCHQR